jgi:spore germination protein GerM
MLRWQDGSERSFQLTVLSDEHGQGLVIGTPPWLQDVPSQPPTQPATLSIRDSTNRVLAEQPVLVLSPNDPGTQAIQLYWTVSGTDLARPETRHIVRTERVGTAALRELLWGPPPLSQIGYETALPTPEQVLRFPGRQSDWGSRVTLLGLTIEDGVATANFSKEMRAYGGGSLRVKLIRDQISQTLRQFPSVREVRIAIEGETEGVLEP